MHLSGIALAIFGFAVLALSIAGARYPTIHPAETTVFRAFNGLPNWLFPVLWLPMQLGNLVVGTLVGLAIAWLDGDWPMAVAVVAAMVLKLVVERLVRKRMESYLSVRQRPGTSQPGAILRGSDVPESGMSFPSGHVILVSAVAAVISTDVPTALVTVPFIVALLVAGGRVYVGAHNPLDVSAGLGAGLIVGGLLDSVLP